MRGPRDATGAPWPWVGAPDLTSFLEASQTLENRVELLELTMDTCVTRFPSVVKKTASR